MVPKHMLDGVRCKWGQLSDQKNCSGRQIIIVIHMKPASVGRHQPEVQV